MNGFHTLRFAWGLALVLSPVLQAKNSDEVQPKILVRLYNVAQVPKFTLLDAEDYATEIFRKSGVEILLRDMENSTYPNVPLPGIVELRIVIRAHAIQPFIQSQETMAIKLNDVRADIIYDRVRSFASKVSSKAAFPPLIEPIVLGHVIALMKSATSCAYLIPMQVLCALVGTPMISGSMARSSCFSRKRSLSDCALS